MKSKAIVLFISVIFIILLYANASWGEKAPAPSLREFNQPTGLKFRATPEKVAADRAVTEKGILIAKNDKGFWCYGEVNGDKLMPSRKKFVIDPEPPWAVKEEYFQSWEKARNRKGALDPRRPFALLNKTFPKKDSYRRNHRTLVLLVDFTDAKIKNTEDTWGYTFFGNLGSTVRNYYREISGGKLDFVPVNEGYGTANDGIVKVSLPYPHPKPPRDRDFNEQIVEDALLAADPYVNFGAFDFDGNGGISTGEMHIVTILAGYERSYILGKRPPPSIFSHHGTLRAANAVFLDGVSLGDPLYQGGYTQHGEMHGVREGEEITAHMATIGVIVHELGHELGLPDLYDTDKSSEGVGIHSLMAAGDWGFAVPGYPGSSPSHPDPWSKIKLGLIKPTVITASGDYTVYAASTGRYNILQIPSSNPDQYFLVENRQFSGYDRALHTKLNNAGIALWHIDEEVINKQPANFNTDEKRKGIDLEEANEGALGYSQLDTKSPGLYDHYFFPERNSVFSPKTVPASTPNETEEGDKDPSSGKGPTIKVVSSCSDAMTVRITLPPP